MLNVLFYNLSHNSAAEEAQESCEPPRSQSVSHSPWNEEPLFKHWSGSTQRALFPPTHTDRPSVPRPPFASEFCCNSVTRQRGWRWWWFRPIANTESRNWIKLFPPLKMPSEFRQLTVQAHPQEWWRRNGRQAGSWLETKRCGDDDVMLVLML